jgi:REP element-mobilizing transposase RayT
MPEAFYRRRFPHLQVDFKQHFVTFCTNRRAILPEGVRSLVLECCLHDNGAKFDLRVVVVMPDHVHMIFTPLIDDEGMEVFSLAEIMNGIKGASAHRINKALGRKGRVWQPESFDHVVRSSEGLDAKIQYVLDNPVRRGLVAEWNQYPWLWKKAFVNPFALVR